MYFPWEVQVLRWIAAEKIGSCFTKRERGDDWLGNALLGLKMSPCCYL